jgi:hypothetical protein
MTPECLRHLLDPPLDLIGIANHCRFLFLYEAQPEKSPS